MLVQGCLVSAGCCWEHSVEHSTAKWTPLSLCFSPLKGRYTRRRAEQGDAREMDTDRREKGRTRSHKEKRWSWVEQPVVWREGNGRRVEVWRDS
ncbi:hypothetical protein EYF80_036265 [Liparis tanakae]|uniref:Uncharacterized protein n=1 Tax=Liparis tanakae TaxID=230148 RepID=A0A4Z2GLI2_9TELE|nr:hypothetical protein EYF80_036265 [Liparis tanakae]